MIARGLRVKAPKPPKPIVLPIILVQPPGADGTTIIDGKTTPRAKLKLDIGANGSTEQVAKADKKGRFQFTFHVDYGTTPIEVIGPKSGRRPRIGELTILRPVPVPHPPFLSLVRPLAAPARTEVTITGQATDAETRVSSLLVSLDGGPGMSARFRCLGQLLLHDDAPARWVRRRRNTLAFTAINAAGNSTVADASFTLDTRAPSITLTAPNSGLAVGSNPTITGMVGDTLSGVAGLQEQLDNGPLLALAFNASTGAFTFKPALPLNETADGTHTVLFQAVDAAGNASTVDFTFILDTTPPIQPTFSLAQTDRESSASGLATTNGQITLVGQTGPNVTSRSWGPA